ncbi:MAG: lysoplasmalogenase [Eubacterium sp.]|nr:lysoplasmalogenase [Eubacterium sp.]
MLAYYSALAVGLIVTVGFLFSRSKGASIKNLFFKMASSLCFLLTGVFAVIANPEMSLYGVLIIMGGILGLCGDITLDLKYVYPNDSHPYLNSGFIFFAIGHLFYSGAIIKETQLKPWWIVACVAVACVIAVGNTLSGKMLKLDFGKYKVIVTLYSAILAATAFISILAAVVTGTTAMIVFAVGAVLFLLSDVVLCFTYFGKGWDKAPHIFINHLLYYAGQFLIASTIIFIGK